MTCQAEMLNKIRTFGTAQNFNINVLKKGLCFMKSL